MDYVQTDPITGRRYADFRAGCGGRVQIVETTGGGCRVGFQPFNSLQWLDWGEGIGGFEATCKRFDYSDNPPDRQTFVPEVNR